MEKIWYVLMLVLAVMLVSAWFISSPDSPTGNPVLNESTISDDLAPTGLVDESKLSDSLKERLETASDETIPVYVQFNRVMKPDERSVTDAYGLKLRVYMGDRLWKAYMPADNVLAITEVPFVVSIDYYGLRDRLYFGLWKDGVAPYANTDGSIDLQIVSWGFLDPADEEEILVGKYGASVQQLPGGWNINIKGALDSTLSGLASEEWIKSISPLGSLALSVEETS